MLIYTVSTLKNKPPPPTNKTQQNPKQTNILSLNKWPEKNRDKPTSILPRKKIAPVGDSSAYRYFTISTHTTELSHTLIFPLQPFLRLLSNQNTVIPIAPREATKPNKLGNLQKNRVFRTFSFQTFHFYSKFHKRIQRNGTMLFKYIFEVFFTFC